MSFPQVCLLLWLKFRHKLSFQNDCFVLIYCINTLLLRETKARVRCWWWTHRRTGLWNRLSEVFQHRIVTSVARILIVCALLKDTFPPFCHRRENTTKVAIVLSRGLQATIINIWIQAACESHLLPLQQECWGPKYLCPMTSLQRQMG